MSHLKPIEMKSPLAGNPPEPPQFSIDLTAKDGSLLKVSDPKAIRAMIALMDMQAVMGGAASHWGGPAALSEIWSCLHAMVFTKAVQAGSAWNQLFNLVNDAGHCENGLYAIKANHGFAGLSLESLKGFRSIKSPLTGHGESHIFPEGVQLSNGPLGSSLPQAQGLCFADALAGSSRVTVTTISDGACMEGEAKEALAAIPGLAKKGKMAPFVLIISDNNTKLSGRIDEQSFSMEGTFDGLASLGWDVVPLEHGNSLEKSYEALQICFERAQSNPNQPIALLAKTIKGYGVKKTADSASGGHGFPLKSPQELPAFLQEIYAGADVPSEFSAWAQDMIQQEAKKSASTSSGPKKVKVQEGVAAALCEKAKKGLPVFSISSDLPGSTGLSAFQSAFPNQFVDIGIAESNMVSMAAGLSKQGYIPVIDTFAQFGVTKGALPLTMASLSEAPVIAIFSHAGFQDAADGASHQALGYLAMVSSIPNTKAIVLSTSKEAEALVGQAIEEFHSQRLAGKTPPNYIFFLGRETFVGAIDGQENCQLGVAEKVYDSSSKFEKSVTVVSCGPLVHQAIYAAEELKQKGIGCIVINNSSVNAPDVNLIKKALIATSGRLLTVEDHQLIGGMGSLLSHSLMLAKIPVSGMKSLAVNGRFGQSAYEASELYEKHELDWSAIVKACKELL